MKKVVSLLVFLLLSFSAQAQELKVVEVLDGDTFVLSIDGQKVGGRLHGADAPELGQPLGKEAKEKLAELLSNETLKLGKRYVGSATLHGYMLSFQDSNGNPRNLSATMINLGLAYSHGGDVTVLSAEKKLFDACQQYAKKNRKGVWGGPTKAEPPWVYRKNNNLKLDRLYDAYLKTSGKDAGAGKRAK